MSLSTLDSNVLYETSFSGFDYPNNAQVVDLLGDGTTPGGNAVLQQSALTLRRATITFTAYTSTARETYRALYESREAVDYVDFEGTTTSVRVLEFSSIFVGGGPWWDCTAVLLEAG